MTGYRVIKFHFESNETQPRMKRTANKVKDPINSSTGNHFCHLLRKVNKNRCSNLLSVPEAHWLEKPQVAPYNSAFLQFIRIEVCSLWRDGVSSCLTHTQTLNWQQTQRQGEKEWETAPCALANRQALETALVDWWHCQQLTWYKMFLLILRQPSLSVL